MRIIFYINPAHVSPYSDDTSETFTREQVARQAKVVAQGLNLRHKARLHGFRLEKSNGVRTPYKSLAMV